MRWLSVICAYWIAGFSANAEASGFTAGAFLDVHDAHCTHLVEQLDWADTSEMIAQSEDEIERITSNLGLQASPDAVWMAEVVGTKANDTIITRMSYERLEQTPASCEQWPEECN